MKSALFAPPHTPPEPLLPLQPVSFEAVLVETAGNENRPM
jgi:hypothetical protein